MIANRKAQRTNSKKGDVLYGKLRPYLNKVIVADTDGVCTTEIIPLSGGGNLNNLYLFFWLKHPEFLAYVKEVGYGVNMPRLGTKDGIAAPFVLAPFAEQQQIAAKLDELLAQVDTLEKRLDTIPKILKRSVVEQTEIVTRVEQLFTYAGQIEQRIKDAQAKVNHLTQAILAKAFRDELTADWRAQNPDLISGENSAEALLAKIKAEREKIKSKNSK